MMKFVETFNIHRTVVKTVDLSREFNSLNKYIFLWNPNKIYFQLSKIGKLTDYYETLSNQFYVKALY